jgi:hypothetical protein
MHESIEDQQYEEGFDEDLDGENIQEFIHPLHEDKGWLSCTPFQISELSEASF